MLYLIVVVFLSLILYYQKRDWQIGVLIVSSIALISYFSFIATLMVLINSVVVFQLGKIKSKQPPILYSILLLAQLIAAKYYFSEWFNNFGIEKALLSIGLSYYGLQNIGYLLDLKWGKIESEKSFSSYFLYTAFFPKIVCGPIINFSDFKNEIACKKRFEIELIIQGFNRILMGLFKKFVVSDRLLISVSSVFDHQDLNHGFTTLFAGLVFTFQVYFDFSGYTDIAIGISKLFGINLKENFNLPFRSKSVTEFWRRWHISLMDWLREYVFYPLSFPLRKHQTLATIVGIFSVFLVSAVWHGIGVTFLIWGGLHFIYLTVEYLGTKKKIKLPKYIAILVTIFAVSFANIAFRSGSLENLKLIAQEIFINDAFFPENWLAGFVAVFGEGATLEDQFNLIFSILFVVLFLTFERRIDKLSHSKQLNIGYASVLILLILVFGTFNSGAHFVYIQY